MSEPDYKPVAPGRTAADMNAAAKEFWNPPTVQDAGFSIPEPKGELREARERSAPAQANLYRLSKSELEAEIRRLKAVGASSAEILKVGTELAAREG